MWCINRFEVIGTFEQIKAFRKAAENHKTVLSFASLYPIPENIGKDANNGGLMIEYWCMDNWGICEEPDKVQIIQESSGYLAYYFSNSGVPPILWVKHVVKMHPHLNFILRYAEEELFCAGEVRGIQGTISETCFNVSDEYIDR